MKATRPSATAIKPSPVPLSTTRRETAELFGKQNFTWMLIGVAVLILGFLLMAGGGNTNPDVFDKSEVYSARRITVAPIIILIGLAIEIYAIFRQPKPTEAAVS